MQDKQRKLLIELRAQLVGEEHTLPYCIYTDDLIEALIKKQPKTLQELSEVKGFPKEGKRVKGYGEAIVSIFTKTDQIESFELHTENGFEVGTNLRRVNAF